VRGRANSCGSFDELGLDSAKGIFQRDQGWRNLVEKGKTTLQWDVCEMIVFEKLVVPDRWP
jgi:hypothetical protein